MSTLKVSLVSDTHVRNGEALERTYIGRRFRAGHERLEEPFEPCIKVTTKPKASAHV